MINLNPYNPRIELQPGDLEYEKLKYSIEEFGYVEPIVWNERTGNLVGGHQQFKILVHEQGATEVEVSIKRTPESFDFNWLRRRSLLDVNPDALR
ncbi:hypothetical protein BBOR36S_03379 [Brevibacillus borstelensis]|jgi:ParB-like chromosome segregation protein Spo0J